MQLEASPPPLFDAQRAFIRRNIKANVTLKPLFRFNSLNSQTQPDQEDSPSLPPNNYSNTDGPFNTSSTNIIITRRRAPSIEPAHKKQAAFLKNENVRQFIQNRNNLKKGLVDSSYSIFDHNAPEPAAFQPLNFIETRNRSTSVETSKKRINIRRKPESVQLDQRLQPLNNTQNNNNNSLLNFSAFNGQGFFPTRERSISDAKPIDSSLSYEQTRQRSPSVGTANKKLNIQRPAGAKTSEFKHKVMTRLRLQIKGSKEGVLEGSAPFSSLIQQPDQDYQSNINGSSMQMRSDLYRGVIHQSVPEVESEKEEELEMGFDYSNKDDKPVGMLVPKAGRPINPKSLVFCPKVKDDVLRKHIWGIIQGVRYAYKQVKAPPISQLRPKQIMLAKAGTKKTLVLDLDETLISTRGSDALQEMLPYVESDIPELRVKIRPYAEEFLKEMSKTFEVIIFTAAEKKYAESVLRLIDPNGTYVSTILHRDHCLKTRKGLFIKDLRILKNRELKDMVIVDNFTPSFSFQMDNGIPIITWEGDQKDQELKYLMDYLLAAKDYDDMRLYNREKLKLFQLVEVSAQKFTDL